MISNDVVVWRIVDWDGRYESSRSLKKTGPLAAVTVSADLGRVVLRRLLERPDSAEILGVWYFLQMLAAQGDRRGVFCSLGAPLMPRELAELSAERGDTDAADTYAREAREAVLDVTAHAPSAELRQSFLSQPAVRRILGGAS